MPTPAKRVVATGIGLIPLKGCAVPEFLRSIYSGKLGVKTIHQLDAVNCRTHLAATVENFDPGNLVSDKEKNRLNRATQMGLVAADVVLKDASSLTHHEIENSHDIGGRRWPGHRSVHTFAKIYDESLLHHRPCGLGVPMAMCHSTAAMSHLLVQRHKKRRTAAVR